MARMNPLGSQATSGWPHRTSSQNPRRAYPLHPLSAGVLIALLLLSVVVALGTRAVETDQDNRLLVQRANEVGVVLGTSISSLESTLAGLGNVARDGGNSLFIKEATGDVARQ